MTRIPIRVLAGVLAVFLLPAAVMASDSSSANAPANKSAESANTANASAPPAAPAPAPTSLNDPLLQLLVSKGVINIKEASSLAAAPASQMRDQLLLLLKEKGVLSAEDLNTLKAPAAAASAATSSATTTQPTASDAATPLVIHSSGEAQASSGPPQPPKSAPPAGPIPAIAPIRVLQVEPAKHEGFIPDIKIGKNVNIKPYGFFKASAVYDTSSPYGNDFPLPGFIGDINGPDTFPEFHVKARFIRIGSNFEWLDSPKLVVTGKLEADFEGNFSRANNRNISTIRSNMFQFRLGYGRIDYHATDTTSVFGLFGQDWTPFASSTLPNLFETTGLGVGFGTLYERLPQFRFGIEHKLGGTRKFVVSPEFAIVLPAFGNLPGNLCTPPPAVPPAPASANPVSCATPGSTLSTTGLDNQLGFGERQGVDSGKPEIQARFVTQFQLDSAAGVAPAQIIISGVHGSRTATLLAAEVPTAFKAAFPTGAQVDSDRNAWTGEIQLPTRFVTLIAKYYNGTDLRFYFGNQLDSTFNDTGGLTGVATGVSVDGSSAVAFGLSGGVPVVAPQRPLRGQGGFVNLGFPLSRIFNADPAGRNAGWALYAHYGFDEALARDVRRIGGGRQKSDVGAGTLQYKLNNFVTFVIEESLYRTRALPNAAGVFPSFDGRPTREWKDFRSEIGPIFSF